MRKAGLQGIVFGAMEGLIMVMGLLMGFALTVADRDVVLLAITVTAIADAFSNTSSLYAEEEAERHGKTVVLRTTLFCFVTTLIAFAVPALPLMFLSVREAAFTGMAIGILGLLAVGWLVAKLSAQRWQRVVLKYLVIGLAAAAVSYMVGTLF